MNFLKVNILYIILTLVQVGNQAAQLMNKKTMAILVQHLSKVYFCMIGCVLNLSNYHKFKTNTHKQHYVETIFDSSECEF